MEKRKWTKRETGFLRSNVGKVTNTEIANALNRTLSSVSKKITKLRKAGFELPRAKMPEYWVSKDPGKEKLRTTLKSHSISEMALIFNVSDSSIRRWIKMYKIEFSKREEPWSDWEDEYLVKTFGSIVREAIANKLKRSKRSVSRRAKLLQSSGRKIAKRSVSPSKFKGAKPSKGELESLLKNFSSFQVSKKLAVSDSAIRYWMRAYGITSN